MREGISVLIPVYNGARYLSECIQSVLAQTLSPLEIIVLDDGSEDASGDVVASCGGDVRYHRVPHGGLPYARNCAIALVEADVIAFIDSDDIWLPRKLELQMAALARETGPAMVFGHVRQFVSADLPAEEAAAMRVDPRSVPGTFASTLLLRKADCDRVGPFDESIHTGEFIEWHSRAADAGLNQITIPEVVCRRRIHRNNMGRGGAQVHGNYVRMLKKVLDRRRSQRG